MMWIVPLPLEIPKSKSSFFPMNLNEYRNAHYQTLNKAKVNYEILCRELLRRYKVTKMPGCKLVYTLYVGSAQRRDVANICSIVDKFFSDALVKQKIIPDDDFVCIPEVVYRFGGIDRKDPRVDVEITPYNPSP